MNEPNSSSTSAPAAESASARFGRFQRVFLLTLLLVDSAYLFIANRASGPPRIELAAFTYEGVLLAHLLLGLLAIGYLISHVRSLARTLREGSRAVVTLRVLTRVSLAVCLLSGLAFLPVGLSALPIGARYILLPIHDAGTAGFLVFGLLYLIVRARQSAANSPERWHLLTAVRFGLVFGIPLVALLLYTILASGADRNITNPSLPPMTAFDEGDGSNGKFFPSSAQSVGGQFFPSAYFMDSASCGVKGCHPDIYQQWLSSAHHRASFNNQWYRKSIEYMQEVIGTKSSKWCGGCHDMAVLLTEAPYNRGHSRMDKPIREQDWPPQDFPEAHAGIGCAVCHSIVHVKSTMGQGDYLADYPPMHKYITTDNPFIKDVHNFLTRLAPEPHAKTFLRPFHVDATAKFCSTCHKVHLDVPVNGYRWFRGFDDYDAWQVSGVSGQGAASFYYPADDKTGQPAFKKCADCHMPEVASRDAGNFGGLVHSHRFPAANTALPIAYHDQKQLETVVKFLQDKALSIDIFALRRQKGTPKAAGTGHGATGSAPGETPRAASLTGEINTANLPAAAAGVPMAQETLTAPLNRGGAGAALRRGESVLLDVVVRTLKLGHAFPAGTTDANEVWVELEAKDDKGRVFFHSGCLQWPNGPVEDDAERYRALLVDGHSNPINKRNAWAARAVVYAHVIPPGAADTVHYRIQVPKDCGDHVTLTAKLNYRKFNWWNTQFAYAGSLADPASQRRGQKRLTRVVAMAPGGERVPVGIGLGKKSGLVTRSWDDRPMRFNADPNINSGEVKNIPNLPIIVLAQNSVTLPVVNANAKPNAPATPGEAMKDRIRWNDYGIGLLLQGDFLHATNAFEHVTQLSPQWPEGYVNIGRVRQAERDSIAAAAAFQKAFALYAAHPTPMTPYQKARTQFFYAQTLFDEGELPESLATLNEVMHVFPDDKNVRDLAGSILFRLGRYDEAIEQLKHTLSIDPEDVAAHYNLMKCYRAGGNQQQAAIYEALYKRFKVDETTTNLTGPYLRKHPADNLLSQPIHEHGNAVIHPMPTWLRQRLAHMGQIARRPATKVGTRG
ncbi:MAG TPA: tetratricopeptide repeat protein [Chthonomonadaceae bacterium]|nr:tetratricopeptide repeat protein [Chthonomonadaceae bacterium]